MGLHVQSKRWLQLKSQHHTIWQAIREHQPEAAGLAARRLIEFVLQGMHDYALEEDRRSSALHWN